MPYIAPDHRVDIYQPNAGIINIDHIHTVGDLNYAISMMCLSFVKKLGGMSYTNANSIVGVLDCAKEEFRRRMLNPYEDTKIEENGDVF